MSAGVVLVDTGPLVALFDPSDRMHERCVETLAKLRDSDLITTLAVVTEASYLLGFSARAQQALIAFLGTKAVGLVEIASSDLGRIAALMDRYADLPMDLADATLLILAERLPTQTVFTLDRRDFNVYRIGRKKLRLLPE